MRFVFLLLTLATATAAAQPPDAVRIVDATGATPGRYYFVADVAEDGRLTLRFLDDDETFRIGGDQPGPDPDPDPDPQMTPMARKVWEAAGRVTGDPEPKKTALLLSVAYDAVATEMQDGGKLENAPLWLQLRAMRNLAEAAIAEREKNTNADIDAAWRPFRDTLEDIVGDAIGNNAWGPDAPRQIAEGLFEFSGRPTDAQAAQRMNIDIAEWLEIIIRLIEFLETLFATDQLQQGGR